MVAYSSGPSVSLSITIPFISAPAGESTPNSVAFNSIENSKVAIIKNNVVKLPYCTNVSKNYTDLYKNEEFIGNPIKENLDTSEILKDFDYGVIKNLYDWFSNS